MKADEIEIVVKKLLLLKKNMSIDGLNKIPEFEDFKKDNKLLYDTVLSNDMDMPIFKQMMKMKRKLEDGEEQYSVDVKFGKFMAEKYVDPVVNGNSINKK